MKSSVFTLLALLTFSSSFMAQANDPVLMTINGKPLAKSEFEYIYNKNNSNNSLDKKSLEEYVDLFVNFKLKVEEAKAQGLDTTASFINELAGYRSQLTKPYLTDSKVDEETLVEAYNRMKEDVEVSHILIRLGQQPTAADTLKAWTTIQKVQKRLEKEDFNKVAKEMSDDQSAAENGGNIGWISAFRTVYPFETMAYNTPIGKISKPVRTSFGYHIVKVTGRRANQGEVLTSHIMRFTSKDDPAMNQRAKVTIDSLYLRLVAGDDFGDLATKFSEDRGTAAKKGELPWFGTGRMVPEFENAAFTIKATNEFTKPVQSAYGWHIIKLLDKRTLASFESLKSDIESKVKRDERASRGESAFVEQLSKAYNVNVNNANLLEFKTLLTSSDLNDSTFKANIVKLSKELISFSQTKFSQKDFANYLIVNPTSQKTIPSEIIDEKMKAFMSEELLKYEDSKLESKHADFRFLMQEYHDGILLFEVSNNEVWDKASKDVEGLKKYFKENKGNYTWEKPHFKGNIVFCKDQATFKAAKSLAKKCDRDSVEKYLYARLNDSIQYVKVEKGLYVQGENKAVDKFIFKSKAEYVPENEFPYVFVIGKKLKNTPEDYTDVRGLVTADYQDYLEREWIKKLRTKYPVTVEKAVLDTIKAKIN